MTEACPRPELLRGFVLGWLMADEIDAIAVHLEMCGACRREIEVLGQGGDHWADLLSGSCRPDELREFSMPHGNFEDETACRAAIERIARQSFAEHPSPLHPQSVQDSIASAKTSQSSEHPLEQLGDFRLLREVGRGGMGIVYEAEQISLGRRVAVKVLPKLLDENQRRRFEREAKAAGRLHHTNIVPVFGVGEQSGIHFYVMQFIEGLGLNDVVYELRTQRKSQEGTGFTPSARDFRVSLQFMPSEPISKARAEQNADSVLAEKSESSDSQSVATPSQAPAVRRNSSSWNEPTRVFVPDEDTASKKMNSRTIGADGSGPAVSTTVASSGTGNRTASTQKNVGNEEDATANTATVALPGVADTHATASVSYWRSVALMGRQVAEALDHAHVHGVLHRDIKPSNLLLDTHGTVWVTDFGLAKADDQDNLTATSDVLGTLRYMSPESFEGKSDARGDVYSLGLTLYELAALQPAFSERDLNKLMKQVTHSDPPRLRRVNAAVPLDLETIIHKAMDREPAARYQTARELADDLQRFIEDEPIHARRIGLIERFSRWSRRNRELSAALMIIVLLLLTVTVGSSVAARHFGQLAANESTLRKAAQAAEANEKKLRQTAQDAQKNEVAERQRAEAARESLRQNLYFSEMIQAGLATESISGMGRVRELLSHWDPNAASVGGDEFSGHKQQAADDLRGWEWHLLTAMTEEALKVESLGSCHRVAWSPDGKTFAASSPGGITLWEVATWKKITTLAGLNGLILGLSFSPDGRSVAATDLFSEKLIVWDVATHQQRMTMTGPTGEVRWFPDGQRVAAFDFGTAQRGGSVIIINATTGEVLKKLNDDLRSNYNVLDISPDGQWIATGGQGSTVNLWETESWTLVAKLAGHQQDLAAVRFHPDGQWVASASLDKTIRIWDIAARRELRKLTNHQQQVTGLSWSADGSRLASASWDFTTRVWDGASGLVLREFRGHTDRVVNVQLNPSGTMMASASEDGTFRVWDVASTPVVQTLDSQRRGSNVSAAWHPNGHRAVASVDGRLNMWDVASGKVLHADHGMHPCWSGDGQKFVALRGKQVVVWNGDLTQQTHTAEFPIYPNSVVWHPDGRQLFVCDFAQLWSWNLETDEKREIALTLRDKCCLTVHPGGRWLLVGATYGRIGLWDLEQNCEGQVVSTPCKENLHDMNWSPDAQQLVIGSSDHSIVILDVASWTPLASFRGHTYPVAAVCWSPEGTRIASASRDGTAQLWDLRSGRSTLSLRHADEVHAAAFSRDGRKLLTASIDGKMKIWNAAPAEERRGLRPESPPPTPKTVTLPLVERNQLVWKALSSLPIPNAKDFVADQTLLLNGVKSIPVGGNVGRLTVFGPNAFPVIALEDVQSRPGTPIEGPYCVLAAGRLEKGRVAAYSHDCWLIGPESFAKADHPQLLDNLLRWLADRTDRSKPVPRIGLRWPDEIGNLLEQRGFPVERLNGNDWLSRLEHVDVLIALTHSTNPLMTESETERVLQFVTRGGGLLTASTGWVWRQYIAGPQQTLGADSLANRLLGPAGILIDDGSASLPNSLTITAPPASAHWLIANRQHLETTERPAIGTGQVTDSMRTFLLRSLLPDR